MIERNFTRRLSAWVFSAALLCGLTAAGTARAQANPPADETRHATQLSDAQKQEVAQWVKANSANLGAADVQLVKKDREALIQPLADERNSTAFRQEYSRQLEPVLVQLVGNSSEIIAINALVVAADLATPKAVEMLQTAARADKPSVRYAAAYGLRRSFEALRTMPSPTLRDDQASEAIRIIGERINAENDPFVLDALVLAGLEAARKDGYRTQALSMVSSAMAAKAKSQGTVVATEPMLRAMLRAGSGVRDALTGVQAGQLASDTLKAAAELGGQLVAYCVRVVENKALPPAEKGKPGFALRETHAQIAAAGETVALLAMQIQNGKAPEAKRIGDKLKQGNNAGDAQFSVDAKGLVGPGGSLSGDPFKFPPNQFVGGK